MAHSSSFFLATAFVLSLLLGAGGIKVGKWSGLVGGKRKLPACGGAAVLLSWWTIVIVSGRVHAEGLAALAAASLVILIFGLYDVKRPLNAVAQLALHITVAVVVVFWGGLAIKYLTHPLGGLIRLDQWQLAGIALPGALFTVIWIVTLMNVVNFLDGMDGLAASVSIIAFMAIGLVSLLPQVNDTVTAFLAFAAAAALGGFLFWNLPPAALMLGTVGSWFVGFLLAVLASQGASKIATTAVVGAVPLLDALAVIVGRLRRGNSPFKGDLTHLHHRLQRRGLKGRSILLLYIAASLVLGTGAVVLQTYYKIVVFTLVSIIFILLILVGARVVQRRKDREAKI